MFRFALQSILDLKLKELEQAEIAEQRLRVEVQMTERRVHQLRDEYIQDREQLNDKRLSAEFRDARILETSLERKKDQIMNVLRALSVLRDNLALVAKHALALRKKTAGMQRLKERRRLEYEAKQERRIQAEIDNRSALQAWNRKREIA
jgi:flagellar biosynthesis chaperone FliJ